ncbi:hypothetical protein BGZ88_003463, partial [Linnemannia elongata]
MSVNQPETPSFLSRFQPPLNPRKKVRTTNQLQVFKFCDYIAEVCYFRTDIKKMMVEGAETITAMKATLILTDYTEHADLPYQDVEERPTGRASIIATLWDEHCQSAQDANLSIGDLVSLKNLVPKKGRNGHIELDMHSNRRYLVSNPVQKLGQDHVDVQELLLRKQKYLEHINEEFVAAQMAARAQQRVGSAVQGLGTASIEPKHEYESQPMYTTCPTYQEIGAASVEPSPKLPFEPQPTATLGSVDYEPESVSTQSSPQRQRTPTPHGGPTTQPSQDSAHNLHLSVYSRLSINASSTASAAIASTSTGRPPHAIQPGINTSFDPELNFYDGEDMEQGENDEVLLVPIPRRLLDAELTTSGAGSSCWNLSPVVNSPPKPEPTLLKRDPTTIICDPVVSAEREVNVPIERELSPLVAVRAEAAQEDTLPVVDTSVERELHGPNERETSFLVAVRLKEPSQDIQPVSDTPVEPESGISVEPESAISVQPEPSVPIERESTPLIAVKLEPDCQDSQPTVSAASNLVPSIQEPMIVRTSSTFVLTEKAKEAKKGGCCLMPLRARVVGFEPETLIDFSSPICRECKHKYRLRSKTRPSQRCPGCNLEDAVEFKYSFKLHLMDELDEAYTVDVDDEHATTLIGVPAGDLVKDFEKLGMVTERLARIGVSEVRNQDEGAFFDLCVQERIKRLEDRKGIMGVSLKRIGSPLPSRETKRHASDARELDGSEWCQTPPSSPPSVEKKNMSSTGNISSVEWSLNAEMLTTL